ncbi:hypothetical protein [Ruminiclostridium josui]|uniref:hypothetical protein n=2 Tax=Ruminiclostridium josui TaxID=1499 RepID=UPI0004671291|nr:hypothetical protein [Ruminiclostridium josui]
MTKTNWQDPRSTEIRSTQISGLQEAIGKIEESIGINTLTESNIPLPEVFISNDDRCRIYQAPEGKRNWLSSPPPIIKKNGIVITDDFEIDYGGGAVIFSTPILEADVLTADVSYTVKITGKQLSSEDYTLLEKKKLAGIAEDANNYTHPESHPANMILLDDETSVEDGIADIIENINEHQSDYTLQIPWAGISTNTDNAYSLGNPVIVSLVPGMAVSFKCNADATGEVTLNWSGTGDKGVLKSNSTPVTNWKNGGVYTVRYDGTNFIQQGEGGDYGTATAAQVLAPYTIGTDSGLVPGTMTDHSSSNIQCIFTSDVTIPAGYYNGSGKVLRPGFSPGTATALFSDNTNTYQTTSSTYVKMLEKTLFIGGTLRVYFILRSGTNMQNAFARIYRNGTPVGIERYVSTTSVVTFTEDISGWLPGDKFQLYMRGSGSNYSIIDVANGGIGITINEVFVS